MKHPISLLFLALLFSCAEGPNEPLAYAESSDDSVRTGGPIGVMTGPLLEAPPPYRLDSTISTYITLPTGSYYKIVRLIEQHGTQWPEPDIRSYIYFDGNKDRYDLSMVGSPSRPRRRLASILVMATLHKSKGHEARESYSCILFPSDSVQVNLPETLLPSGKPWKDKAREVIIALQYK